MVCIMSILRFVNNFIVYVGKYCFFILGWVFCCGEYFGFIVIIFLFFDFVCYYIVFFIDVVLFKYVYYFFFIFILMLFE